MQNIRNFCIIAHIDHGKSTLADRLLELTGAVSARDLRNQFMDNGEIERERGITIKAKAVLLKYRLNNQNYILNLIDTPGHVDFSYEVLRSLKACEGALLLVDATQGVQAQTVANALVAMEANLKIIPVINKIDMPAANIEAVRDEIQNILGIPPDEIINVSAKQGTNADKILEAVVERVPPPSGDLNKPLKALIFDAVYDEYRGVIIFVRMIDGSVKADDQIIMIRNNRSFKVEEVVSNLLDNSLKFTPAGGSVWLSAEPHFWERRGRQDQWRFEDRRRDSLSAPNAVRVVVADTGPGIEAEYHQEIFNDFFRIPRPNESHEGTGLGLAIARRLVQAHGGKIWVESEPGAGCKVSFLLPWEPAPTDE